MNSSPISDHAHLTFSLIGPALAQSWPEIDWASSVPSKAERLLVSLKAERSMQNEIHLRHLG
jgi:hypothetical protein